MRLLVYPNPAEVLFMLSHSFRLLICAILSIAPSTFAADEASSVIRVAPNVGSFNISWPCSVPFHEASLDFSSDSSSSAPRHAGSSLISSEQCCRGSESHCEWTVAPLLSDATYHMTLAIFTLSASDDAYSPAVAPSIHHLEAHTLSPFTALPPSLSFTCDALYISWLLASPPASTPLQAQQLVATRSPPGISHRAALLLNLSATQSTATLLLPLPSTLSGVSVQFAIVSYFAHTRGGVVSNSSSLPSAPVNILDNSFQAPAIAATAGMHAFADSNSVTVVFESAPALAFVALFSSTDFHSIGCNRSRSSVKIGSSGETDCSSCGFQRASRTVIFQQLPASSVWTVALCVPTVQPPSPCPHPPSDLTAAATILVRTANTSQAGAPEVTHAAANSRGVRVCWRHASLAKPSWNVTIYFNANSSLTYIKSAAEVSVGDCTASHSCLTCSELPLDTYTFCANQMNSNASLTVVQRSASSPHPSYRPSSAYPIFSLCAPPSPKVSACLIPDGRDSHTGVVNVSWPPQPVSITQLLLTVYHVFDAGDMSTVHNVTVAVSTRYILLPLPKASSCCLVARGSTLLDVFSEATTPICGLQVHFFSLISRAIKCFVNCFERALHFALDFACIFPHTMYLHLFCLTCSDFRLQAICQPLVSFSIVPAPI
jgi:hypothetical protein